MTEIEVYRQPAAVAVPDARDTDSWIEVVQDIIKIANVVYDTPFVPDGLRGSAPAVAAAMLAGREMGLGIMTSLANIDVIKGKPTQKALLMRAMIQSKGHKWQDGDVTDTRAVVRGCRRGESEWTEVAFTADQAKKAGIDLGRYPADKLYARASSRLARRKFADVIMGMPYTEDDIEDGLDEDPAVTEVTPAIEAPKPAQRTARRRTTPSTPDPTQPASVPPVTSGPASGEQPTPPTSSGAATPDSSLPPLPGEDEPEIDKDAPGSVTKPQLTKLGAIFTSYGFTTAEREQRLVTASTIVCRELESSSELSLNEARVLIDTLERCGDRERLMTLLATGEMPEDEASGA